MVIHAAFGGSTNLLLHVPAIAYSAGLARPTVEDWISVNRQVPRLVDVLPNGPVGHPTIRVFMAGGVPEAMLHLRELGLLHLDCPTVSGQPLDRVLDWWARSERRLRLRERLASSDGIDPKEVILSPQSARQRGLSSTVTFPRGNLAPEGSVIKSTAIDPSLIDADGVYRKTGPARVFSRENDAKFGIHFTQVTPRCSMCLRGGLSTRPARVRGMLRQRRGLSRLSVRVALAGGFPLSGMRA